MCIIITNTNTITVYLYYYYYHYYYYYYYSQCAIGRILRHDVLCHRYHAATRCKVLHDVSCCGLSSPMCHDCLRRAITCYTKLHDATQRQAAPGHDTAGTTLLT